MNLYNYTKNSHWLDFQTGYTIWSRLGSHMYENGRSDIWDCRKS